MFFPRSGHVLVKFFDFFVQPAEQYIKTINELLKTMDINEANR